ncbi:S-methyl-5-thioribose kinase [Alsobacter sp. R-9]
MDGEARVTLAGGPGYAPLGEDTLRPFLAALPDVRLRLGGDPAGWTVREVGDGNLNLVFIVKGAAGGVVVKQALPYVRLVGDSWPLPLERAFFEARALSTQARVVPELIPTVYCFDPVRAAIVMELLEPHVIMRKGLIAGTRYPGVADAIATFCARTLFSTSDLGEPAAAKRERQALFSRNVALCKITEDLVFTDPYRVAPLNRWTSPQLDAVAVRFREDAPLKVAAQELKWAFLSRGEALIHGDLHTGSIMVTETDTRVIDPEFAVYGPMGFDTGAFLANLLLAFFAQEGHATPGDDREAYRGWILDTAERFWLGFHDRFLALWREGGPGDVFPAGLMEDDGSRAALEAYRHATMRRLFEDTLGFAACKMIRRILGLAHVADLESIADPDVRARCEAKALSMARTLMLGRATMGSMADVRSLALAVARERHS